jgi:hypothetical protein
MSTTLRRPMPAFALFVTFFEAELKRFADKGTLGVKLSWYQAE